MSQESNISKGAWIVIILVIVASTAIMVQNHLHHKEQLWWFNYLDDQVSDVSGGQESAQQEIEQLRYDVEEARDEAIGARQAAEDAAAEAAVDGD
jgi:cytoskeletal protein RodZ